MSSLQDKMKKYEVEPPAGAWDRVAAALDESASGHNFPARLYEMEVIPPAAAWDSIRASLQPAEATVVPMKRRVPLFVRYAAAVVLIGVIAAGIIKWTAATTATEKTGTANNTSVENTGASNTAAIPDVTNTKTGDGIASEKSKGMVAKLEQPSKSRSRRYNNTGYTYASSRTERPTYTYEDHVPGNVADRYIMLMTPDGNFIRMSKKWEELICCVSGEEQDADCKSQLKKWQEKIAAAPLASSPGNFMDIVNLVSSLNETTEL